MSYDEYANHIIQKYRLALSIAIYKTKPENVTLENHIQHLRGKLNEENMDLDSLSISICSDDFNFDETNDFSMNFDEINNCAHKNDLPGDEDGDCHQNDSDINNKTQDCHQNTSQKIAMCHNNESKNDIDDIIDHQNDTNNVEMISTQNFNDSITILHNFDVENEGVNTETEQRRSLDDVMDILKGIDDGMVGVEQETTSLPSIIQNNNCLTKDNLTQCYTDLDTQCESLEIVPSASLNVATQEHNTISNDCNTILEPNYDMSNENLELLVGLKVVDSSKMKMQLTSNNTAYNEIKNVEESKTKLNDKENKEQNTMRSYRHTKEFKNVYQNVAGIFGNTNKNLNENANVQKSEKPLVLDNGQDLGKSSQNAKMYSDTNISQDTIIYNITQDLTCNTHCSQSQMNDIITIEDKYIHGIKRNNLNDDDKNNATSCKKRKEDVIIISDEVVRVNKKEKFNKMADITIDIANYSQDACFSGIKSNFNNYSVKSKDERANEINADTNNDALHTDSQNYLDLQELPNVLIPSNNAQVFDRNIETQTDDFDDTQNKSISNASVLNIGKSNAYANTLQVNISKCNAINNFTFENDSKSNANTKVRQVDKDLFSEESQSTNFSTISIDTYQNYISDDSGLSDIGGNFRKQIYRKIDQRCKEATVTESCAGFDKNFNNAVVDRPGTTNYDNSLPSQNIINLTNMEHGQISLEKTVEMNTQKNCENFDRIFNSIAVTADARTTKNSEALTNMIPTESCNNFDDNNIEDIEEVTELEVVPFKIMEELNKVKLFLSKRIEKNLSGKGYSSDAGYRSDSGSKNSLTISQSSTTWVDQSAHSLFNYLKECPLVITSEDIINEISLILGQLIDKLHEEEKYPTFLEDLLETIQRMLRLIFEDNDGENMLTKKDDYIHRIILYNRSMHIQKYTIDKITQKLEKLHAELTSNDEFEIQHIDQMENSCHIFHLLEILLQKYNKTSQNLSQSTQNLSQDTQNSQEEEKTLRKSGLMDVWRKKWNPNFKEIENEGSQDKICVIDKCSVILNKLIVGCMEGYSLISYYALKCFNAMQKH